MSTDVSRREAGCVPRVGLGPRLGALLAMLFAVAVPAAADPAVQFVQRMANELHVAARAKSPQLISNVIQRYGDVNYIGSYSLGTYRAQLAANDRQLYHSGIVKFLGRYAANEAPKYPVAKYEIISPSVQGANGTMVDSRITLKDGSTYDVRWLLVPYGGGYKVRDAMVLGLWMTPFLKKLFEDYIAQNGGNPRALTAALNR